MDEAQFEKKEDKEKLLSLSPKAAKVNFSAPTLNEEISADLHPKVLSRDEYFKEYQNFTGAALSAATILLSDILNDGEVPLVREDILQNLSCITKLLSDLYAQLTMARKTFIIGRYEDRIQKALKKVEPTELLFGDNLKGLIDTAKAITKVSKELKSKPQFSSRSSGSALNWRSSTIKKEVGRGSYQSNQPRAFTSRQPNQPFKQRQPSKKFYSQTQPQRNKN
ncbi:uncharacterized protein LOC122508815 [Leptopilina heterotoma]|uniref:uncharacterized protein LOC122508815 n=1 Tax=Leptopilina heterotoma TaxID=63436 RepID=UPI001CAA1AEC|nr:uncharacterized protein LOC122508815 [Leptopilina heterotoma]